MSFWNICEALQLEKGKIKKALPSRWRIIITIDEHSQGHKRPWILVWLFAWRQAAAAEALPASECAVED